MIFDIIPLKSHEKKVKKRWEWNGVDVPEQRLLCAMLERAILDLYSSHSPYRRSANIWLKDKSMGPWSFNWTINKLNLSSLILKKIEKLIVATER